MFRILFSAIFIFLFSSVFAAPIKLSDDAQISILTCSQGDELYSAFGHSALRVSDTANNIDWVFNYGTFDFNTPNFYLKFANGQLKYILSISEFKHFLPEYFKSNRSVIEQVLNISATDKQKLFEALMTNYKPENRYYKYDFFYDNCATRIFDIIDENIEGGIILIEEPSDVTSRSFRMYLHHYLAQLPWVETGLNTILGYPADKIATQKESTFLPDFLMDVIDVAQVQSDDGNSKSIVLEKRILLEFEANNSNTFSLTPVFVFFLLLVVVVVFSIIKKRNALSSLDRVLFFVLGFIGVLISYLWFVADHSATGYNYNVLWSFPSFLFLAFANSNKELYQWVLKLNLIIVIVFIVGFTIIPQSFPLATIPVALIVGYRLFSIIRNRRPIH
ncbi:Lnb N-terminal periplasmic domain-containing protein [Labilibacter marinus]|uniref:Lnb N-terminal periplasmic domain-containing protein n=1 Tax=Labilibacter marinus TaxID=1477105 RepID=UPI00082F7E63|nr:DUF4105 domain-containing protein [Labilibacter marinus]